MGVGEGWRCGLSRRRLLAGAGAAALAALVPSEVLAACSGGGRPAVFDDHQQTLITEATARLVPGPQDDPAEAGHPGAREANVTGYITTMMGALSVSPPRVFAGGPFSNRAGSKTDDMESFLPLDSYREATWRQRLAGLKTAYDQGLAALDAAGGAEGFLGLDGAGRDRVLATNPKVSALPSGFSGFTDLLFAHAIEGMYSAPEYGGNAGLAGWKDIGFPGDVQPRGYPPETVSSALSQEPYTPEPVVAAVLQLLSAAAPAPILAP
jgi:hypothetical protein